MLGVVAPKLRHLHSLTLSTEFPLENNVSQDSPMIEHLNQTQYESYNELT